MPGLLPADAECPGARDHLDVRRAQHGRAADPRTGHRRFLEGDKPWAAERLPLVEDRVRAGSLQLSRGWAMPSGSTAGSARAT
jgi:hypothetical protein